MSSEGPEVMIAPLASADLPKGLLRVSRQADQNGDVKLGITGNRQSVHQGRANREEGKRLRPVPGRDFDNSSLGCPRPSSSAVLST